MPIYTIFFIKWTSRSNKLKDGFQEQPGDAHNYKKPEIDFRLVNE